MSIGPSTTKGRSAWLLLPAALCTLVAHAVAYRSFLPAGSTHAYFGWYEPLVGALSVAALAAFGLLLGLAAGGRRTTFARRLASRLRSFASADGWARLAAASVALFLVQESTERSLAAGAPTIAALPASTWLVALVASAATAGLVCLVARSGGELARLLLRRAPVRRAVRAALRSPAPRAVFAPRRQSPLAARRGLRAPPLRGV